jgi:hypothetical protein
MRVCEDRHVADDVDLVEAVELVGIFLEEVGGWRLLAVTSFSTSLILA